MDFLRLSLTFYFRFPGEFLFLMVETFGQFGLELVTRFNQRGEPKFSNVYQEDHQQSLWKENMARLNMFISFVLIN